MTSFDERHRDKNGEISRKHGNTKLHTLRQIYGPTFGVNLPGDMELSDALVRLDELSLSKVIQSHAKGSLEDEIRHGLAVKPRD